MLYTHALSLSMETPQTLPVLTSAELRVLGALMEKARATPDYYPMTINGLIAACNQKTSRNPVVNFDEETVVNTLNTLKRKGLVSTATGGTSRAIKYKHNVALVFPFEPPEVAILCLLLLRGPQTPGELNTNSARLWDFDSLEEVQGVLEKLSAYETPFVMQLPRRAGQKEMRFAHLLGGVPDLTEDTETEETSHKPSGGLEARLSKVEEELAQMKAAFEKLMKELIG